MKNSVIIFMKFIYFFFQANNSKKKKKVGAKFIKFNQQTET